MPRDPALNGQSRTKQVKTPDGDTFSDFSPSRRTLVTGAGAVVAAMGAIPAATNKSSLGADRE